MVALDKQLDVAEKTLKNREEGIEVTQALKEAGMSNELAVQRAITQKVATEEIILNLKHNILLLENTLSILMGKPSQKIDRNSFEQLIFPEGNTDKGYPIQLLSNRTDVRAAEYNLAQAFEMTQHAKASLYPSLRIDFSAGLQSLDFNSLFSSNSLFTNLLGSLTQPILNRRQLKTQVEVARSNEEIALLNFKYAILNASKEVSDSYNDLITTQAKIKLKEEELKAFNEAADISNEMQKFGIGTYLDVLTAEQGQLNAELELINLKNKVLIDQAQLYRALGGGWQ